MPYVEAQLNGAVVVCAGADDIHVLTAHIIANPSGDASVGVHSMRLTDSGRHEYLDWLSRSLSPGDRIEIALMFSAKPTAPKSNILPSVDPERIVDESKQIDARMRERFPEGIPLRPRAPGPIVFRVCTGQTPSVDAALGHEEQLQAVLNWTRQGCVLEVDALTVLESGYTKGQRWLREQLSPGQRVQVTYVT